MRYNYEANKFRRPDVQNKDYGERQIRWIVNINIVLTTGKTHSYRTADFVLDNGNLRQFKISLENITKLEVIYSK